MIEWWRSWWAPKYFNKKKSASVNRFHTFSSIRFSTFTYPYHLLLDNNSILLNIFNLFSNANLFKCQNLLFNSKMINHPRKCPYSYSFLYSKIKTVNISMHFSLIPANKLSTSIYYNPFQPNTMISYFPFSKNFIFLIHLLSLHFCHWLRLSINRWICRDRLCFLIQWV